MSRRSRPHVLGARWSKKENDLIFDFPSKPDGALLYYALTFTKTLSGDKTLVEELTARGYDITTLRFTIERRCGKCRGPREPNHACKEAPSGAGGA